MLNYNHLYYFYTVARLGSVSHAARVLHTSQPSLSAQLKTFESANGVKLFQRAGRNLVLTEAGKYALGYCREIFGAAEQIETFFNRRAGQGDAASRISLGVSSEVDRPFAVELMGKLVAGRPGKPVRVTMLSTTHEELLAQLKLRTADIVLTNRPAGGPDARIIAQLRSPVLLVGSRRRDESDPKGAARAKDVLERLSTGLALPPPHFALRREIDSFLAKCKISHPICLESDILSALTRAVRERVGVSFLPRCYIISELREKRVKILPVKERLWDHQLYLIAHPAFQKNPFAQELIRVFSEVERA